MTKRWLLLQNGVAYRYGVAYCLDNLAPSSANHTMEIWRRKRERDVILSSLTPTRWSWTDLNCIANTFYTYKPPQQGTGKIRRTVLRVQCGDNGISIRNGSNRRMASSERSSSSQSSAGSLPGGGGGGGGRAFALWYGVKREVGNHTYYDRWMESTRQHWLMHGLFLSFSLGLGPSRESGRTTRVARWRSCDRWSMK